MCKRQWLKRTWKPLLILCFNEDGMSFVYGITHSKDMSLVGLKNTSIVEPDLII